MPTFFNTNLRFIRKQKGISQKVLAKIVGVDQSTISLWEKGMDITVDNAVKVAEALNVPIPEFLGTDLRTKNETKNELSEQEELNLLTETLKKKGFLDENEKITEKDFNMLIDFAKANKQFIIKDDK